MWENIINIFYKDDPEVLGISNAGHIEKTKVDQYVYIVDQTSMELAMAEDCTLIHLPDALGSKFFYSIGTRKNSVYEQLIGEM